MSVRQGSSIIAIGNVAVDGDTTSFNANNSLQANGVINKNTAVGATEKIYDWVGTLAEYTAQDIVNNHPDWLCFITDDNVSDFVDFADTNASNFTNAGKGVITTMGYPDVTRAESLTPLASGSEYTAPENGYFYTISAVTAQNAYTYIRYSANMNDMFRFLDWKYSSTGGLNVWCPVKAGEKVLINYNNVTLTQVYFIPAYGQA